MLYGYSCRPPENALKASGGMQVAGEESGEAQDNAPPEKPAWNCWFAATAASTALLGTPGAIPIPPTLPKRPPLKVWLKGGFPDSNVTSSFSKVVAKRPKPARRIVLGPNSYASAARGCHCTNGTDANGCSWFGMMTWFRGWLTSWE